MIKATVFLEPEELEELRDLAERRDCPPIVQKLVDEIDMWQEEA